MSDWHFAISTTRNAFSTMTKRGWMDGRNMNESTRSLQSLSHTLSLVLSIYLSVHTTTTTRHDLTHRWLIDSLWILQLWKVLWSRPWHYLDTAAPSRSYRCMRPLRQYDCCRTSLFCESGTLELALHVGGMELVSVCLFLYRHGAHFASVGAQPRHHVPAWQSLSRSPIHLWQW